MSEKQPEEVEVVEESNLPVGSFDSILAKPKNEFKWIDIPEWDCRVKIKSLTKAEQIKVRKVSSVRGQIDETKLEMNMLVYSLVEPKLNFDQVDTLFANSNAKALNRLSAAVLTFSGLTEDYLGEAEADFQE